MAENLNYVEGSISVGMAVLVHCCFCEAQHSHQLSVDEIKKLDEKGEVTMGSRAANCSRGEYKIHVKK